jgi:hypothetical protein
MRITADDLDVPLASAQASIALMSSSVASTKMRLLRGLSPSIGRPGLRGGTGEIVPHMRISCTA